MVALFKSHLWKGSKFITFAFEYNIVIWYPYRNILVNKKRERGWGWGWVDNLSDATLNFKCPTNINYS